MASRHGNSGNPIDGRRYRAMLPPAASQPLALTADDLNTFSEESHGDLTRFHELIEAQKAKGAHPKEPDQQTDKPKSAGVLGSAILIHAKPKETLSPADQLNQKQLDGIQDRKKPVASLKTDHSESVVSSTPSKTADGPLPPGVIGEINYSFAEGVGHFYQGHLHADGHYDAQLYQGNDANGTPVTMLPSQHRLLEEYGRNAIADGQKQFPGQPVRVTGTPKKWGQMNKLAEASATDGDYADVGAAQRIREGLQQSPERLFQWAATNPEQAKKILQGPHVRAVLDDYFKQNPDSPYAAKLETMGIRATPALHVAPVISTALTP